MILHFHYDDEVLVTHADDECVWQVFVIPMETN
jgi:hypothetical protein